MANNQRGTGPVDINQLSDKLKDFDFGKAWKNIRGRMSKWMLVVLAIVVLLVIILALLVPFSRFYTDALWYNHLGFQNLFWKMFWAKILMAVIFGVIFFAILYGNMTAARKLVPQQKLDIAGSPLEEFIKRAGSVWSRVVKWVLLIIAILAAVVAGIGWAGKWELVLRFLNHSNFGVKDPYFHKDAGFYMFSYPFQRDLVGWLIGTLFFVLIVTILVYILQGGIRLRRGPDMFAPHVLLHLSILLAVIFLLKAWSYRLNMYDLLFKKDGVVQGIGYTSANARIPALWILLIISIAAAVLLLINVRYKGWLLPAIAVGALIVVTIVAGTIYPAIIQTYVVKPNEQKLESKYIQHNIDFTRMGYKLNKIQALPFAAETNLSAAAITANRATIRNVRLWDPTPLLDTFQQLQSIRLYYVFNNIGVDRYVLDTVYRQTMIAAREMLQSNLPAAAKTWVNQKLVYTHGYAACMAPSNDVTAEGNPNLIIENIPPVSSSSVKINLPQIYFGEKSTDYVVTNTTQNEFDYPAAEKDVFTTYKGHGGVKVNSFWRKLLFAFRFADYNLVFSGQVNDNSQVMYNRTILDRVSKCAPFLQFDSDPYMVVSDDGRLFWISDGYATNDFFPYSTPTEQTGNYIRNSVKAVVDAYNGDVSLYVIDPADPVIRTYRKIFPHIFKNFDQMPQDLRKHIRYPEGMFTAQASILRTYHMTNANQFYTKEDQWDFPNTGGQSGNASQPMPPYYVIMKIPGEAAEEMILMLPFTPHNKPNMISWLAARMDGTNYGTMINFRFPSGKNILGPEQVEGRIEQDPTISAQLSLWRQAGSEVVRGNLLVIPIEESLIYVEPLYLQATQIKIPQVKRVVVVYGNSVVMEPTLDQAMARIFFGAPPTPIEGQSTPSQPAQPQQPSGNQTLQQQALNLYNLAVQAQKNGDWTAYGNYLNQLQSVLQQLAGQK